VKIYSNICVDTYALLGRAWVRRDKNNSLLQNYFFSISKAKSIKNKELILTSPLPTLPSQGGLQSCTHHLRRVITNFLSLNIQHSKNTAMLKH